MRHSLRLVASTALGAVLLLSISVDSTLAKADVVKYDLGDAWCFQDGIEQHCTVQKGTFTIETRDDGSTIGKVDMTVKVEITASGQFVARYSTKRQEESRSSADGSYTFSSLDRTKWTDGDEKCDSETRVKIVDFEVVVDTITGRCH